MAPRILVYGFGPYLQYKENITSDVLCTLPRMSNVKRVIFPVVFCERQFVEAIKKSRPEFVLGLGQCGPGDTIRSERMAVNMKGESGEFTPIGSGDKSVRFLSWFLREREGVRNSYDAGRYVCNFSMYVIARTLESSPTCFAFLHIPADHDLKVATRIVHEILLSAG